MTKPKHTPRNSAELRRGIESKRRSNMPNIVIYYFEKGQNKSMNNKCINPEFD